MTVPIGRIESLQVLRGIAALLIMAKHALYEVDLISTIDFHYGNFQHYSVGIDIFFVLSGFIMVYISRNNHGAAYAKTFMIRRILRIVPPYWFYTLLLAVVAFMMPQVLGKAELLPIDLLKSLFFIPFVNNAGDIQPFLALGWSLNYEMYFYAIFALCLILPARYGIWAMAGYFLVSVLSGFFGLEGVAAEFYGRPIILEFLAGAFIGYLLLKDIRLPAYFIYVGWGFVAVAVVGLFYTDTLAAHGIEYSKPLVGIFSVLLLALPRKAEEAKMPRAGVMIGDSSYTLYLAHPFAIGAVTQVILLLNWQAVIHPWIIFMFICAITIIGSIIAYIFIEKPLLSFTKSVVYKKKTQIK